MLQLYDSSEAFLILDEYLRGHGFFGPERDLELSAELYLGYGLSAELRRDSTQAPAEPCELPLLACRVRHASEIAPSEGSFDIGEWSMSWQPGEYRDAIEQAQAAIGRGDVYQVNLVQHMRAPFAGDPAGLAQALLPLEPRFPRALIGEGWAIASASPELFLAREGERLWTMPIKGTRSLSRPGDLTRSAKERAEHVMIVDLERNDLARVCVPGSVRWPELMLERPMAGVSHMVSRVEGVLLPDLSFADLLAATFPGGSITGAPKISAIDHIAAIEPVGRGAAMGALGTVYPNGDFDLSLTIRTFAIAEGEAHLWVGGGIVADSDPDQEVEESWVKARPLLDAISLAQSTEARSSDVAA